ncbi:LLM class flavin-dependent oxidoreductase [Amycolatopsis sp. FDAARGOS 1241]|uniref:LLM class flavin-dependent oxidoreductase n=1 Tax=Amycolatopsis sp. FDAARGOS 1241 TaxID=2778070 RepID=UPI00194F2184|nr:TIGR03619 family F420-dependent LLM class oxidoreductase [Amycolatopsis sp. FDAARGOS 1241]QRP48660.1 TIGR03619 family F420-dependent LLM class oxidoreductase [Amycolatopsis sp. FDAARGOS 1241]
MTRIEFGVRVPNSGPLASVANVVRVAQAAEQLSFDSVWVHDHVVWSSEMHRHHISSGSAEALADDQTADFYESLTTLAYLAAKTTDVKLGVACLVMPTRNPIYAAKQTATLDHLTGGRLIVGVGLGSKATESSSEFDVFQVPFSDRGKLTDEYIEVMKTIWTEPLASYTGRTIKFTDAEVFPKPRQSPHPPVWVGGWTDRAAARTGRLGDGWIPGWLSPAEMARGRDVVRRTADEAGRDGEKIVIAVEKLATIAEDREVALTRALPTVRQSSMTYERDVDDMQFALDRHIFGSVDDVRHRVAEFVDAGVAHFELKLLYASLDELIEQMTLWSTHVLPEFR